MHAAMDTTRTRASADEKISSDEKSATGVAIGEAGALPPAHIDARDIYGEDDSGVDPVYEAKAKLINDAFEEIGMGKYQVRLLPWSSHRPPHPKRARVCPAVAHPVSTSLLT